MADIQLIGIACAVKIWLKIALNAVRLAKFEAVNGKSWSLRTMVVSDLPQRDFAHAQKAVWFVTVATSHI